MRRNHSQAAKRRSHHGLKGVRLSKDQSGGLHLRHRVNPETGMYRGKVIIDVVARAKRDARRAKRKQTELRASGQSSETKEKENAAA